MNHIGTGNCRIATVCMTGNSPLGAALAVQQPTLAANHFRWPQNYFCNVHSDSILPIFGRKA